MHKGKRTIKFLLEQSAGVYSQDGNLGRSCIQVLTWSREPTHLLVASLLSHGADLPPGSIALLMYAGRRAIDSFISHILPLLDSTCFSDWSREDRWALLSAGLHYPAIEDFFNSHHVVFDGWAKQQLFEIGQLKRKENQKCGFWFASYGSRQAVKVVFTECIHVNSCSANRSYVAAAARSANLEAIEELLKAGAESHHIDRGFSSDSSALGSLIASRATWIADEQPWLPIIDSLINRGFTVHGCPPYSPGKSLEDEVLLAVVLNKLGPFQKLLNHSASFLDGYLALLSLEIAILLGRIQMVQSLLVALKPRLRAPYRLQVWRLSRGYLENTHLREIHIPYELLNKENRLHSQETFGLDGREKRSSWLSSYPRFLTEDGIDLATDQAINSMLTQAFGPNLTENDTEEAPQPTVILKSCPERPKKTSTFCMCHESSSLELQ